jgi:branched-chain amino acid transport system permease protein
MRIKRAPLLLAVIVLALLIGVPQFIELNKTTMNLLVQFFIYAILALSWNFMAGFVGQYNLGFAAFFGCGVLGSHLLWRLGLPIYLTAIIGGAAALALAVFIGLPTLRLKGMYFAIGTFALAEALRIVIANVFPRAVYSKGDVVSSFTYQSRYYLGLVILVFAFAAIYVLMQSRLGLALKAIRDDERAAQVSGVNTFKAKVIALLVSALLAGLAGALYAYYRMNFDSLSNQAFTSVWSFAPLIAVAIGGLGTFAGPVVGSVFYVVLSEIFGRYLGKAHFIVLGALFIVVLLYFPHGLMQAGSQIRTGVLRLVDSKRTQKQPEEAGG